MKKDDNLMRNETDDASGNATDGDNNSYLSYLIIFIITNVIKWLKQEKKLY